MFVYVGTWFAETVLSAKGKMDRVAPGSLILKSPTSIVGYYKMFDEMVKFSSKVDALNPIFWHFLLQIYCSLF